MRSASTVVASKNGQTIVIGGLLSDSRRDSVSGVPFLSDVPVLGNLFRRTEGRRVKTNLLAFLTPHVVSSDTQMATRSEAERAKLPPRGRAEARRSWSDDTEHRE